MNREAFHLLEVDEQVRTFNNLLVDSSIRKVCGELGIGKTTIRNRFRKSGYIYARDKNQYIREEKESKSNDNLTEPESNINITKEMYDHLTELIEMKEKMREMIEDRGDALENKELMIQSFDGELKVKSVKVYGEVLENFHEFMENHRELKQQDVISQALWEFLQKYK